jgi:hypothetical protein
MATLEQRLSALATAIGADIKALNAAKGDLSALTTTQKANLVVAINEIKELAAAGGSGGASIDDTATTGATTKTWSADKIISAIAQLKSDLVNGAPSTFDTLKEIADYIASDQSAGTALATSVANRVRFDDVMTLTVGQKTQACTNIGAVETATAGDITVDLAAAYVTAKA